MRDNHVSLPGKQIGLIFGPWININTPVGAAEESAFVCQLGFFEKPWYPGLWSVVFRRVLPTQCFHSETPQAIGLAALGDLR